MQESTSILIIVLVGCALFFCMVTLVIFLLLIYTRRHQGYIKDREQLTAQFTQTLLQSQIEIQEQTLTHISRELHDNLGQTASLIKLYLNTVDASGTSSKLRETILKTKDLTKQLITDIKLLSVKLSSDNVIRHGLIAVLESEKNRLNSSGIFIVSLKVEGELPEIDRDKTLILHRMVQEIINNIVKHSMASEINILLSCSNTDILLRIVDNGVGFNIKEQMKNEGAGLFNLSHRATVIGATLIIDSDEGQGTIVTIQLAK